MTTPPEPQACPDTGPPIRGLVESPSVHTNSVDPPQRPGLCRPCRYCVANWAGITTRGGSEPIRPSPQDCEWAHRDDQRVYDLARAIAKTVCGTRNPSDEQVAWYLEDADEVVDDFNPAPATWSVRKLPPCKSDGENKIEVRLRINGVTYVALEGGKDCRGSVVKLWTFRSWRSEAVAGA